MSDCYFARHRCARISEKTLFVSRGVSATIIDGQYVPTTAVPRKGIALVQPRIKWPTSPHLPKARCTSMIDRGCLIIRWLALPPRDFERCSASDEGRSYPWIVLAPGVNPSSPPSRLRLTALELYCSCSWASRFHTDSGNDPVLTSTANAFCVSATVPSVLNPNSSARAASSSLRRAWIYRTPTPGLSIKSASSYLPSDSFVSATVYCSTRNFFLFFFNIDSLLFPSSLLIAVLRFSSLRVTAGVRFFGIKIFIFKPLWCCSS